MYHCLEMGDPCRCTLHRSADLECDCRLSELAGLELPTGQGGEYLGGVSQVPVMHNPQGPGVKDVALSQFPRCWQNNTHYEGNKPGDENNRTNSWESMSDCHWTDRLYIDYMGYRVSDAPPSL